MNQTTPSMNRLAGTILLLAVCAVAHGCGLFGKPDPRDERKERLNEMIQAVGDQTLSESDLLTVVPDAEGGAYAFVVGSGVWYLNGAEGVRVSLEDRGIHDVIPDIHGGAYARTMSGGLWYLKGASATKVREVSELSASMVPDQVATDRRGLWVLLQYERSKRAMAEGRAAEAEDTVEYMEDSEAEPSSHR